MNMRMVRRVMEGTVPFQILHLDSMCFGDFVHIPPHEIFPRFRIIEMQALSIFTAKADHPRPDNAIVIGYTFCDSVKVNRHIELRKQSVRAELFNAGTVGDVADQAL